VVCHRAVPLMQHIGLAVLRGNPAPDGAVIQTGAADPGLLVRTRPAVVSRDYNDMTARIESDALFVDQYRVIVLQHAGPARAPGVPEWGQLPSS
jgi:dihydroxy-acid dehydratase